MFPFVDIFGRDIGLYSVMALCGVFSAGTYACIKADKKKYNYTELIIFALIFAVGAMIGSHLLYTFVNYKDVIYVFQNIGQINTFDDFLYATSIAFGGSVYYGSLLGGILTGYIVLKKNNTYAKYVDIVAAGIPLFHFFGRIGCYLAGCCYGIPSKIGFTYTINPFFEANGVSRFPTPLLEASFNLILFFFLNHLLNKKKFENNLLSVYLVIYATGRFFIEFLRGDTYRGIWWVLSTSQIISILIILFVLVRQFVLYKKSGKSLAA